MRVAGCSCLPLGHPRTSRRAAAKAFKWFNPLASTQPRRDLADCLFPNVAMLSRSVALPQRSTTALLALTLAVELDRIDVTARTRWQQLVCAFLLASGRCAAHLSYRDGRRLVSWRSCADSARCPKSRSAAHVNEADGHNRSSTRQLVNGQAGGCRATS